MFVKSLTKIFSLFSVISTDMARHVKKNKVKIAINVLVLDQSLTTYEEYQGSAGE